MALNRNFNSDSTSGLTICHTPGGAQAGAATLVEYFGASASGGRVAVGGAAESREEFILKQNTAYLIQATSRADGNALSIIMSWYEHTNEAYLSCLESSSSNSSSSSSSSDSSA